MKQISSDLALAGGWFCRHALRPTGKVSSTVLLGMVNRLNFSGQGLAVSRHGHSEWKPTSLASLPQEKWRFFLINVSPIVALKGLLRVCQVCRGTLQAIQSGFRAMTRQRAVF